jgi:hypothetical protein
MLPLLPLMSIIISIILYCVQCIAYSNSSKRMLFKKLSWIIQQIVPPVHV